MSFVKHILVGLLLFLFALLSANAQKYKPGDTFRDCATCPEMVVVPAGKFMMGTSPGVVGRDNELPRHQVTIAKPFAVGKYEVTVGQYKDFVRETKHRMGACMGITVWQRPPVFEQSANHPVVCVKWNDANAFAFWLSTKTGQDYRLLSEAEWEYVARAGTTTAYHFGRGILGNLANYNNMFGGTVAVGSYPANKFGLHDMHGNVWEWVEDCWHNDYTGAPTDGSAWVTGCDSNGRVLRGGSWNDYHPENLRSAGRYRFNSDNRYYKFGFRIARTLTP